jgi:hypothetical protein
VKLCEIRGRSGARDSDATLALPSSLVGLDKYSIEKLHMIVVHSIRNKRNFPKFLRSS